MRMPAPEATSAAANTATTVTLPISTSQIRSPEIFIRIENGAWDSGFSMEYRSSPISRSLSEIPWLVSIPTLSPCSLTRHTYPSFPMVILEKGSRMLLTLT